MATKRQILIAVGTRAEVIKLASVIDELRKRPWASPKVVVGTDQGGLTTGALRSLGIGTSRDLGVRVDGRSYANVCSDLVDGMTAAIADWRPSMVIGQGDTTTTFAAALASFYAGVKYCHVDAGLRSGDRRAPFPEEAHRRMIAAIADLHCAATERAQANLLAEGVARRSVVLAGNTALDTLRKVIVNEPAYEARRPLRTVVLTSHRAETDGEGRRAIFRAATKVVEQVPDIEVIVPVYPDRKIRLAANEILSKVSRVRVIAPLDYADVIKAIRAASLVITDSGGLQEECAVLGVPTLVVRNETERPESVASGVARLVGTDERRIVKEATRLLRSPHALQKMRSGARPPEDGLAGRRIVQRIEATLSV